MSASTPRTIVLKAHTGHNHEERAAAAALKPGHLIMLNSSDKVLKHATAGGWAEALFATEDALQSKSIDDAYAADDIVSYHQASKSDIIKARVAANASAIVIGDKLVSNGDGCLKKASSEGSHTLYVNAAASSAITNTNTETAFDVSYTIPASTLQVGDVVTIKAQVIATSTNSTDTLTIKVKQGSNVLAATAAVDVANNDIAFIEVNMIVRTIGASGTYVAAGMVSNGVAGTATMRPVYKASTTIDTTATQAITVTAEWSVAHASNSCRLDILDVELSRINPGHLLAVANEAKDNSAGSSEAFIAVRIV